MVDGTLLSINIAGGISVIMGYTFVYLTGTGSKLYKIFTSNEKTIFLTLSALSIISFFYLLYWSATTETLREWRYTFYIVSLAVYLFGASIWSPIIYNIVKEKQHPYKQIPALFITGIGTLGMLISIAAEDSNGDLSYSFAMTSAILLAVQHAFFDLFYWSNRHAYKTKRI